MSFDSEWLCQPCYRVMSSEQIVCDRLCQTCDLISSGPERLCQPWGPMSSERFAERLCQPWGLMSSERTSPERLCQPRGLMSSERFAERLCQPWGLMSSERLVSERLCQPWRLMSSGRIGGLCQSCGLLSPGLLDLHTQLAWEVGCAGQPQYDEFSYSGSFLTSQLRSEKTKQNLSSWSSSLYCSSHSLKIRCADACALY